MDILATRVLRIAQAPRFVQSRGCRPRKPSLVGGGGRVVFTAFLSSFFSVVGSASSVERPLAVGAMGWLPGPPATPCETQNTCGIVH